MEFTNEEMVKSLTSLIDETLEEIEEIKKSKFAASEISLGDSESGLAGKSKNGSLEAKKKEDKEDEEEEKDEKKEEKKDMDKAECSMSKKEDKEDEEEEKDEDDKDEKKEEKKEMKEMKKSLEASESLLKSYVDQKMSSIEEKLSKMAAAIEALADAPAPRKGVPAGITPLHKSADEVEPLSKTELANKLFELKKSGKEVDSSDIFMVETGNQATALQIANKYGLR